MRVLFITQEVEQHSAVLGVTLTWIRHLASRLAWLHVLALGVGPVDLPERVSLYSMGKERTRNKLVLLWNFQRQLWDLLRHRQVDVIFIHMVPRYAILAYPLARLFGVPLVLWYAHGAVSRQLRIAHRLVDAIVTASPESCRIHSPKVNSIGHGIDVDRFQPQPLPDSHGFSLLTAGRLSPSKDYATIIRALALLREQRPGINVRLRIAGAPFHPGDEHYVADVKHLVAELGLEQAVSFIGAVPGRQSGARSDGM
jgi:glycosyltransferase involved in cell wall biosynthesis